MALSRPPCPLFEPDGLNRLLPATLFITNEHCTLLAPVCEYPSLAEVPVYNMFVPGRTMGVTVYVRTSMIRSVLDRFSSSL
jgi:hypothetical protein